MKKRIAMLLALVMALSCFCVVGASAAYEAGPSVRVNGTLVSFPDAAPYIDENSRTMIPVRFVAENLGAKVSWEQATNTATIEKNGAIVEITIGNAELRITKDGMTATKKMDTAAVLRDSRTYVPIRFVAEALGAYVDYSDTYRTVGIYSDVLTPDQIKMLLALPYTQQTAAVGYEEASRTFDAEDMVFYYGTDRSRFSTFANAREHLYHIDEMPDTDAFYADMVEAAVKSLSCSSDHMAVRFLADTSCLYQADSMDRLTCTVRGIAEVTLNVNPLELTGAETAYLCRLGFTQLNIGTMYIPVDAHMNTTSGYEGTLNTIVPAGTAY